MMMMISISQIHGLIHLGASLSGAIVVPLLECTAPVEICPVLFKLNELDTLLPALCMLYSQV